MDTQVHIARDVSADSKCWTVHNSKCCHSMGATVRQPDMTGYKLTLFSISKLCH
jgi:hypothetical protein